MFVDLLTVAPTLNPAVAERAEEAYTCETSSGQRADGHRLIVVDMNLPSSQQRLWAFDLRDAKHPMLILKSKVAHGIGSDPKGEGVAHRFGNDVDSGMTSLGLYRVAERFANAEGRPAFSLDGLDEGFNDRARDRHVVFHPSAYVLEADRNAPGRSLGCPAVDVNVFAKLEKGMEGALLWIDGPETSIEHAPSLACARPERVEDAPAVCEAPTWYEVRGFDQGGRTWLPWQRS